MRLDGRTGLLLSQGALCLLLIAGTVDALRAHGELRATLARQRQSDELVGRIDAQLDALARGTQALAQGGDADAAAIIETLAQSGVHIAARPAPR